MAAKFAQSTMSPNVSDGKAEPLGQAYVLPLWIPRERNEVLKGSEFQRSWLC
jgi:hypothetical protein